MYSLSPRIFKISNFITNKKKKSTVSKVVRDEASQETIFATIQTPKMTIT